MHNLFRSGLVVLYLVTLGPNGVRLCGAATTQLRSMAGRRLCLVLKPDPPDAYGDAA